MTDRKAVIKNADMSEDMQQDAVDCATQAIEKYNIEKVSTILCCDREILLEFLFVWIVMRDGLRLGVICQLLLLTFYVLEVVVFETDTILRS